MFWVNCSTRGAGRIRESNGKADGKRNGYLRYVGICRVCLNRGSQDSIQSLAAENEAPHPRLFKGFGLRGM